MRALLAFSSLALVAAPLSAEVALMVRCVSVRLPARATRAELRNADGHPCVPLFDALGALPARAAFACVDAADAPKEEFRARGERSAAWTTDERGAWRSWVVVRGGGESRLGGGPYDVRVVAPAGVSAADVSVPDAILARRIADDGTVDEEGRRFVERCAEAGEPEADADGAAA